MCDQGIKDHKTSDRMNRTGHVAPASRADRKDLPVETNTGMVYNGSAGKKVGALTGKEKGTCDGVEKRCGLIDKIQSFTEAEMNEFIYRVRQELNLRFDQDFQQENHPYP